MNVLSVLQVLRQTSPISRAEIARITGLTPATISSAVSTLMGAGIVHEVGLGESNGGRPPILLRFDPGAFYLAGVDLGVSKIIAAVTDLDGKILSRARVELNEETGKNEILSKLFEATRQVLSAVGPARSKVMGIGVSVPGLTDVVRGVSVFAPNMPSWWEVPVAELFEKEFKLPSWVENDARAMALGEARFGAGRGRQDLLCVNVGRGIGAGIILNGELYRGKRGGAGELGHTTVNPDGPVCPCGNNGCLEVLAAGPALAGAAVRAINEGAKTKITDLVEGRIERVTAEIISVAAREGDPLAGRLIQEAGRYLGIGIANAVNLLCPELVIIGGGVSRAGDILFDEIRATVKKRAFTTMVNLPQIVPSSQGEDASCIGAAALVLEEMLEVGRVASLMKPPLGAGQDASASRGA